MFNVSIKFNTDAIEAKIIKATEAKVQEKLRSKGLGSVRVKVVKKGGNHVCEFSGPEEDVKKAKSLFSN